MSGQLNRVGLPKIIKGVDRELCHKNQYPCTREIAESRGCFYCINSNFVLFKNLNAHFQGTFCKIRRIYYLLYHNNIVFLTNFPETEKVNQSAKMYSKRNETPENPHNNGIFGGWLFYSHSIVAGGLLVISYTIRLIFLTSFTILTLAFSRTSYGIRAKSAVIKSVVVTPRSASV